MPSDGAVDTDVLIVGAGPVGLFLANECSRRGLRFRIVEARSTQSEHSKALAIFPRTLEIFDMAGLVAPFLEAANRVTSVAVVAHQRPLADMSFAPEESAYPFVAMVPQNVTERLLLEQLRNSGGEVEYETTLVSADPNHDCVVARMSKKGELVTLKASFVVGCDGAHSSVRRLLGLPFEGGEYDVSFMLADVATNETLPAQQMQLCPNESGPVAIFPMSAVRRRIVATVDSPAGDAPSLELVQRILAERAPAGIEARGLYWSTYFRIHHRQVSRLRAGRIFVAGDAAHIHSPFGGQGMNTGLHDVWNLVWKLDFAVHGRASEALMNSYNAERRPIIKEVVETTDRLTRAMATPSKFAQMLRDTLIPAVSHLPPFQHAFVNRLSGLGISYRGSAIVEGAGKRFFDDTVRGGKGIASRFLLICSDCGTAATREAVHRLADSLGGVVELRSSNRPDTVLVRPDGYIAYSSHHRKEIDALNSVRSLLQRQVH
jgi:2-polyprenyl-6-methoxyphenol hydroxylase-like FAD-dependent oxidoreductase